MDGEKISLKRIENIESEDEEEEEEVPVNKGILNFTNIFFIHLIPNWGIWIAEKRKSFEHKRRAHYNEFMAVKLARQLMQKDEDEDDVRVKEPGSTEVDEVELESGSDEDTGINVPDNAEMDTKDSSDEATVV